jgi:hypothetical protein
MLRGTIILVTLIAHAASATTSSWLVQCVGRDGQVRIKPINGRCVCCAEAAVKVCAIETNEHKCCEHDQDAAQTAAASTANLSVVAMLPAPCCQDTPFESPIKLFAGTKSYSLRTVLQLHLATPVGICCVPLAGATGSAAHAASALESGHSPHLAADSSPVLRC